MALKTGEGMIFETGKEVWKMSGGGDIQIPTPIVWQQSDLF